MKIVIEGSDLPGRNDVGAAPDGGPRCAAVRPPDITWSARA